VAHGGRREQTKTIIYLLASYRRYGWVVSMVRGTHFWMWIRESNRRYTDTVGLSPPPTPLIALASEPSVFKNVYPLYISTSCFYLSKFKWFIVVNSKCYASVLFTDSPSRAMKFNDRFCTLRIVLWLCYPLLHFPTTIITLCTTLKREIITHDTRFWLKQKYVTLWRKLLVI